MNSIFCERIKSIAGKNIIDSKYGKIKSFLVTNKNIRLSFQFIKFPHYKRSGIILGAITCASIEYIHNIPRDQGAEKEPWTALVKCMRRH